MDVHITVLFTWLGQDRRYTVDPTHDEGMAKASQSMSDYLVVGASVGAGVADTMGIGADGGRPIAALYCS